MPIVATPKYLHEPTPLQCGQAVLAMLSGKSVEEIIQIAGTDRETTLNDMKRVPALCGIEFSQERKQAYKKAELPEICMLSIETPRCWHWSLYFKGVFYDPEYGILEDFMICDRRYYWEIYEN